MKFLPVIKKCMEQMYPTLNGKTSIHKSLDDLDHPQTHIISPECPIKVNWWVGYHFTPSRYARSPRIYDRFQPDAFRLDQELVHYILFDPF